MPTYDYECTKCGHAYEHFQKMTDAKLTKCPKCAGKLKRLIGPGSGIIFKGSGFYQTDYKKSSASTDQTKPGPSAKTECPRKKEGCDGCR
jgi:putative FmdB family regulatory protein